MQIVIKGPLHCLVAALQSARQCGLYSTKTVLSHRGHTAAQHLASHQVDLGRCASFVVSVYLLRRNPILLLDFQLATDTNDMSLAWLSGWLHACLLQV